MDTVNGLRSLTLAGGTKKRKRGRAVMRPRESQERLRPTAAPVDTFVSPGAAPDVSSNLKQLSQALGSLNPVLERYARQSAISQEAEQANLEKEQMEKVRYYTEVFTKDKESGAINQAQVKELLPELVPSVAARVAQATGEKEAKEWLSGRIQSILENDELRLNTQAREAELQSIRTEALERIGDNEFYGAGFLGQMDRSLNEFGSVWMRETASYQEQLQKESLSSEVAHVLNSGGDLLEVDTIWKNSSSLNHKERNDIVVSTVLTEAVNTMNHTLLDRIPDRFLNAESKADIAKAKLDINNGLYTQYVQQQRLKDDEHKATVRQGKVSILNGMAEGQEVNPLAWRDNPEVYQFASTIANQPKINPVTSQANARKLRSQIMLASTDGDFKKALGGTFGLSVNSNEDVSESTLIDFIASNPSLNPAEKTQLINDVPNLMTGVNFIRDPDFNMYFTDNVGSDAQVFAQSPMGTTLSTSGVNVLGEVRKTYMSHVRQAVLQHIEDHGEIPRNRTAIMEKAEEAARKRLEFIQKNALTLSKDSFSGMTQDNPEAKPQQPHFNEDGNLVLPDGQTIEVKEK